MKMIDPRKKHKTSYLIGRLKQLRPDNENLKRFLMELDKKGYEILDGELTDMEKVDYLMYNKNGIGYP